MRSWSRGDRLDPDDEVGRVIGTGPSDSAARSGDWPVRAPIMNRAASFARLASVSVQRLGGFISTRCPGSAPLRRASYSMNVGRMVTRPAPRCARGRSLGCRHVLCR